MSLALVGMVSAPPLISDVCVRDSKASLVSLHNAGNQLTADATHSYQYDDNGNLIRKTLLATGNYTQYSYDAENRLTKVEDFAAGATTPFASSTYRYDGLGRRIQKTLSTQSSALSTAYIYDGEDILLEYDGANALVARYTHGPGIDEPLAVTKGSSTFFYHQDGLGSVTDLTDSAGATAKSYSYDAYGNILESPGTVEQPYTYTGREFDAESGHSYYRARYYDPASGRFLQQDPIGFNGGENWYAYVGNNVANYVDPVGLKKSARWIVSPHVSSVGVSWDGVIWPGTFIGAFPPRVGLIGFWYLIKGEISGVVECTDEDDCGGTASKTEHSLNLEVSKRFGIGVGLTTLKYLNRLRAVESGITNVEDAVAFYRNEWVKLAGQILNDPMTWCYTLGGF